MDWQKPCALSLDLPSLPLLPSPTLQTCPLLSDWGLPEAAHWLLGKLFTSKRAGKPPCSGLLGAGKAHASWEEDSPVALGPRSGGLVSIPPLIPLPLGWFRTPWGGGTLTHFRAPSPMLLVLSVKGSQKEQRPSVPRTKEKGPASSCLSLSPSAPPRDRHHGNPLPHSLIAPVGAWGAWDMSHCQDNRTGARVGLCPHSAHPYLPVACPGSSSTGHG
ncbi:hypothetical protein GHT09_001122 [Marmota monax]|uniref:Uncharacterized protein n=1 Tax=Marmota monax TaxID=9995 RepID=A0A834UQL1_MARMO|nr:hypothetical protein GHT09_001122 [Marmota monax]